MRYSSHFKVSQIRRLSSRLIINLCVTAVIMVALFIIFRIDLSVFLGDFWLSLTRVSIGYVIALLLALVLTLVTLQTAISENILLPILDVLQSFPSFALIPLLAIYFGRSHTSVIIVLSIAMIWPILFATISAFKGIKPDLAEAATIFGAVGWKRLWYFTLPAISSGIVTGSIVAWGEAWDVIIGAEIILRTPGLGQYFSRFGETASIRPLLAIGGLLLIIYLINKLLWLPLLTQVTKYQNE